MEGPNIFRSLFPVVDGMWPPPLRAMSSFFLGRSPVSVPAAPLPPRVPRTWISPLFGTVGREGGAALQLFAGPARLPPTAHSPDGVGRERGREGNLAGHLALLQHRAPRSTVLCLSAAFSSLPHSRNIGTFHSSLSPPPRPPKRRSLSRRIIRPSLF